MKTFTLPLFLVLLACVFQAQANIWTVSNNPAIHGTFTQIAEAQSDARVLAGDTLMVSRSGIKYTNVTLTKPLVLIGEGYKSNKEQGSFLRPFITDILIVPSGSGSVIMGFYVTNRIYLNQNGVNDIVIRNCRLNRGIHFGNYSAVNWLIEENILESQSNTNDGLINGTNANNFIIRNNVFGDSAMIRDFKNGTINVSHNVFISGTANKKDALRDCEGLQVTNNIFYRRTFPTTGLQGNVISNNIFFEVDGTALLNNTTSGNIEANPLFINFPDSANGDYGGQVTNDWNFKVQAGSPALGVATDGDDIGLMDFVVMYGSPYLPYVTGLTILNPTVTNGSNLSIQLKVKYPQNN